MHRLQTRSDKVTIACKLILGGIVQGVGFRPFVYRTAVKHQLDGYVKNSGGNVIIVVQGNEPAIDSFCQDLIFDAPSIANPILITQQTCEPEHITGFSIYNSDKNLEFEVHIPTDIAVCDDCLHELFDTKNRRYHYPFINCTQCGPRYTLIHALPYDRSNTTMSGFQLCPTCQREYNNPADRRFHAEPIACQDCGPRLVFTTASNYITGSDAALNAAVCAIEQGEIIILKGIGGYHIVCDATNKKTIETLRHKKPRPDKPFAIMFPQSGSDGLGYVRQHVNLTKLQARTLLSHARPVVLCERRQPAILPDLIAPGLTELGVMLPYSPLHHLLLNQLKKPIIATSANISGEPVLINNNDIESRLRHITSYFFHHDRPIHRPADDAVIQIIKNKPRPLRLGRGTSPVELTIPFTLDKPVIACGGHMKNTVALAWNNRIVISPHIGELNSPRSLDIFEKTIHDLQKSYNVNAQMILCDCHPGYASHKWAKQQTLPSIEVLHHHAHASCLVGEFPDEEQWLVFTWDGVGLGNDGSLWGGEALYGNAGHWQRLASWRPFYLPGGESAARDPWRSALALCWEANIDWPYATDNIELLHQAWQKKQNCPKTSSIGRLFDAAAALTGVCNTASFEGQAAMYLQNIAAKQNHSILQLPIYEQDGLYITDWQPILSYLLDFINSSMSL